VVTLTNTSGEVARLHDGDFFGEMSLLTGEPRTATVTAATDCRLLEIGVEAFRRVALADPAIVEQVTAAVGTRRAEMHQHRAARTTAAVSAEPPHTFLARVRGFLRL
jgi:CRP-like cAMP-binding protein